MPRGRNATQDHFKKATTRDLHTRGFPGQKLRLGGDALGADPAYLLYLPSRSRGELRRIDVGPDSAGATLSDFAASESTRIAERLAAHLRDECGDAA